MSHLKDSPTKNQTILKAYLDTVVQDHLLKKSEKEHRSSVIEQAYVYSIKKAPSTKNGQVMGGILQFSDAQLSREEDFSKSLEKFVERLKDEQKTNYNSEHEDLYKKYCDSSDVNLHDSLKNMNGELPNNPKAPLQAKRFGNREGIRDTLQIKNDKAKKIKTPLNKHNNDAQFYKAIEK